MVFSRKLAVFCDIYQIWVVDQLRMVSKVSLVAHFPAGDKDTTHLLSDRIRKSGGWVDVSIKNVHQSITCFLATTSRVQYRSYILVIGPPGCIERSTGTVNDDSLRASRGDSQNSLISFAASHQIGPIITFGTFVSDIDKTRGIQRICRRRVGCLISMIKIVEVWENLAMIYASSLLQSFKRRDKIW